MAKLTGDDMLTAFHHIEDLGDSLHEISPEMGVGCMCIDDSVAEALQEMVEKRGLSANTRCGPVAGAAINLNYGILVGIQMGRNQAKALQEISNLEELHRLPFSNGD